jgi:hypothetical protein
MRALNVVALAGLALCGSASAADFAMMETAERIREGTFKLSGFPVVIDRGNADDDAEAGFAVGLGYGLPYDLDVEAQVAAYEDGTYLGTDLEWNAWRANRMSLSIGGGAHGADLEKSGYAAGVDGTLILSYNPIERFALSAALDASYDDVNDRDGNAPADARFPTNGQYETYYAVPGASYLLTENVDLLLEVGFGLNGNSDDYAAAGASWYFR